MESKFINRYHTFCRSLENLSKSVTANPNADFVLEATVQNFNLTFDISWKVMKDLLVKRFEIVDFAIGSPREVLQKSFTMELISDDVWLQMLKVRNHLAHDYDGELAKQTFSNIITDYYQAFCLFRDTARKYYTDESDNIDSFQCNIVQ